MPPAAPGTWMRTRERVSSAATIVRAGPLRTVFPSARQQRRSRVDLPQPEGPSSSAIEPRGASRPGERMAHRVRALVTVARLGRGDGRLMRKSERTRSADMSDSLNYM